MTSANDVKKALDLIENRQRTSLLATRTIPNPDRNPTDSRIALTLKTYQSRKGLLDPPEPLDLNFPSTIDNNSRYRYSFVFPPYIESYESLDDPQTDRLTTIRTMAAFLQTVKDVPLNRNEDPLNYYVRCMDLSDDTLLRMKEKATQHGLTLDAYLNGLPL